LAERRIEFWDEDSWNAITSRWPAAVRRGFATRLRVIQQGGQPHSHAKPLTGFAISLWELWHRDGQRVVYTVEYSLLTGTVYVLDAFAKDSRDGKTMRKSDKARIERRAADYKKKVDRMESEHRTRQRQLH